MKTTKAGRSTSNKSSRWWISGLLASILCGCLTNQPSGPASRPGAEAALVGAQDAAREKTKVADSANEKYLAQIYHTAAVIKANVEDANDANFRNPDGHPKTIIAYDLNVVTNYLTNVVTDLGEQARVAERRALIEANRADLAYSNYLGAASQAHLMAEELRQTNKLVMQLTRERDEALAKVGTETTNYIKEAQTNKTKYENQIKDLQDAERKSQVRYLRLAGLALLLIFGLAVGFGQIAGARIAWPLGLMGLMCLGLAQLVSQWWFMWACGGVALAGLGLVAWWVWNHYHLGNLEQAVSQKATALQSTLGQVVPILDKAYDDAAPQFKDFMDTAIFQKLGTEMDSAHKKVIHEIRAGLEVQATLPETHNPGKPTTKPAPPAKPA
ncbi:MAG: hypothetical protein EPO07_11330 [Verrucomicrobia bacterium]|nr:MAG: hypothetical protein EPO07_11330 [Verrucomicrobiota bacterium]